MNISAKIQFGDNQSTLYNKEYLVVECKCHLARSCNAFIPTAEPFCDEMCVTVVAPDKYDLELYDWYLRNSFKNGRIVYYMQDVTSTSDEEIERYQLFEDAQCYKIEETYDKGLKQQRLLTLHIVAQRYAVSDIEF